MSIYVPKVKEVTMFKEIALNIKNPCEMIREALSNSYDSDSKNIWITIKRNMQGDLEIIIKDDGNGMDLNEIHSFYNLGDSQKVTQNIGEKGLGTKTYFKSKKIIINTKKINNHGYNVIMDEPWEKLLNEEIPIYSVTEKNNIQLGTEITIVGYSVDNGEKYFNFGTLKDYILWFTAGGNFKNIFANKLILQSKVKNMNKACKIYIKDELNNKQGEMTGVHQFSPPNETPNLDPMNKKYKRSVNYCRAFGPFHRETTINGQYVSIQLYGTVSGVNCRKKICKLKQSETYKSRFGIYLCKDFIPFERANFLLKDEQFYHYHLLANSQNFVLTADRNSLSNSETIAIKWIFDQIEDIFRNEIKPIAEKEYFALRKEEEEAYDAECRILGMNKYIKKLNLIDNLYIKDIPIIKIPQCEYEVALLFVSVLSNKDTKSLITDIKSIISYSSRMTTDMICNNSENEIVLVELEYKLSNVFKHKHPLDTYDYVVCWKIDIPHNKIYKINKMNVLLISESHEKYLLTEKNKKIKVIEINSVLNTKYRD